MLLRIAIIFSITGLGHFFSVFAIKHIFENSENEQVSGIALIESSVQLIIQLIAFGLQSSAIRNIALSDKWQAEYNNTQIARSTLGLLIGLLCALGFYNGIYIFFLAAPLVALSGDYALYARGFPVHGAFIAFLRILFPYLFAVIVIRHWPDLVSYIYFAGLVVVYLITNFYISRFLEVQFFYKPRFNALLMYIKNFNLGLISMAFYFFGLGIILVSEFLFDNSLIAVAFVAIKFYVIYKGVLRVLHQAFVREMIDRQMCLKIDQLSILAGFLYLIPVLFFPTSFITLFFGEQLLPHRNLVLLTGLSAFTASMCLSISTRALLERKEILFMKIILFSVSISLVSLLSFGFLWKKVESIGASLLIGELVLTLLMASYFLSAHEIWKRLRFILITGCFLMAPFLLKYFYGDGIITFISGLSLFIILSALLNFRKFLLTKVD
jgi:hypothetical protein